MKKLLFLYFLVPFLAIGQKSLLVSGPMIGFTEHFSTLIWVEVAKDAKSVKLKYWKEGDAKNAVATEYSGKLQQTFNPLKFELEGLEMNTSYQYEVLINNEPVKHPYELKFKTKELWEWRKDAPDFSFLFGSCVYGNDSVYDRPGKPYGQSMKIMEKMGETPSDLMIWGGDNLYLREVDFSSRYGIKYRYSFARKEPAIQKLLGTRANYAILDDHDFGPNDSNSSYDLKETTSELFKQYWGNQTYGENGKGLYSKFRWSDAEFFLLDDRSFRTPNELYDSVNFKPNPEKKYLGEQQLEWLKHSLISSKATFKLIVVGGQVLNTMVDKEAFRSYPYEFNSLMDFIRQYRIDGVVFLTGDRHFTELLKIESDNFYPLYDLTCSPLTSSSYDITKKPEFNNPNRVQGTLVMESNFAKINVTGKRKERILEINILDEAGTVKWTHQIKEQDLKVKRKK